jgi:hypothetical protein
MKCTIYNPVRRLAEPVAGSGSLWAFDYSLN